MHPGVLAESKGPRSGIVRQAGIRNPIPKGKSLSARVLSSRTASYPRSRPTTKRDPPIGRCIVWQRIAMRNGDKTRRRARREGRRGSTLETCSRRGGGTGSRDHVGPRRVDGNRRTIEFFGIKRDVTRTQEGRRKIKDRTRGGGKRRPGARGGHEGVTRG